MTVMVIRFMKDGSLCCSKYNTFSCTKKEKSVFLSESAISYLKFYIIQCSILIMKSRRANQKHRKVGSGLYRNEAKC